MARGKLNSSANRAPRKTAKLDYYQGPIDKTHGDQTSHKPRSDHKEKDWTPYRKGGRGVIRDSAEYE